MYVLFRVRTAAFFARRAGFRSSLGLFRYSGMVLMPAAQTYLGRMHNEIRTATAQQQLISPEIAI